MPGQGLEERFFMEHVPTQESRLNPLRKVFEDKKRLLRVGLFVLLIYVVLEMGLGNSVLWLFA